MSGHNENSKKEGGGVEADEVDLSLPPPVCQNDAVDSFDMTMMGIEIAKCLDGESLVKLANTWLEIAKYLDGKSLVKLASTCKWFYKVVTEECVWKYACLRDLGMPNPGDVSFKWKHIYASAFDGTHSYHFRQSEKHIEWSRIGAFFLESPAVLLTGKLMFPRRKAMDTIEKMLENIGLCVITNIKTGIWIADLQFLHCPVCGLNTCDGTMLVFDTRHFELFLSQGYQNGSWDFTQLGSHKIKGGVDTASGSIADLKHLKDASTAGKNQRFFATAAEVLSIPSCS